MPLYGPATGSTNLASNLGVSSKVVVDERDDGSVVILWVDKTGGANHDTLHGEVVAADGSVLVPDFLVTSSLAAIDTLAVAVRESDGAFLAVWKSNSTGNPVLAQLFDASGNRLGGETTITDAVAEKISIAALGDGGFMVAWQAIDRDAISAQRLDASGAEVGNELTLVSSPNSPIDNLLGSIHQLPSGEIILLAEQRSGVIGGPPSFSYAQTFDLEGHPTDGPESLGSRSENADIAFVGDGTFFVAYDVQANVQVQRFDADAEKLGAPVSISGVGANIAALPDGGFVLAWVGTSIAGNGTAIFAQSYNAAGIRSGPVTELAVSSQSIVLADVTTEDDGSFEVTWKAGSGSGNNDWTLSTQRFESHPYPASGTFIGTPGGDNLIGGEGDDVINALAGNDRLFGWTGNDRLDGGTGADVTDGGPGDDFHYVDNAGDVVIEEDGEGLDNVLASVSYVLGARAHVEVLSTNNHAGTARIDLTGNVFAQTIIGNAATNYLNGGGGGDLLQGLGGDDYYYVRAGDRILEEAGGGLDNVWALTSFALNAGAAVEVLSTPDHSQSTAIDLTGNELHQTIIGTRGRNVLDSGGGMDRLEGLAGDDFYIVRAGDVVIEAAGAGLDNVLAAESYTLNAGAAIEVLSTTNHGGTASINLVGNELDQTVIGNAGNNYLDGGGGADYLQGLGGNDTLIVDADDKVLEAVGGGFDTVAARQSYNLAAGQEIEVLSTADNNGTAAIALTGNEFNQSVIGNAGNNYLDGGFGVDRLIGLGGNDTYITDGDDIIMEAVGGGFDTVAAKASYSLAIGVEVEILSTVDSSSTVALNLAGNEFAQILYGNAGANLLDGKGGNDTLQGFGGADTFAFTTALGTGNVDAIADMVSGVDRIALDHAVFTGLGPGPLPPSAFATGASAQDADDRIIYDPNTGALYFDPDGNGAGAAIQFATLAAGTPLASGDFVVI